MRSDWIEAVGKISTHPPVKGGTLRRTGMDSYIKISTHPPVKGGTADGLDGHAGRVQISIHPPVKGGTANLCNFLHKIYIIRW